MSLPTIIKIKLKNEEKTMTYKTLEYNEMKVSVDDPILRELIDKASKDFGSTIDTIKINIEVLT